MSSVWIDHRHMVLSQFGAVVKGTNSVVTIKVEVSDPHSLGYLLKELGDVKGDGDRARKEREAAEKAARRHKSLLITHQPGDME